MNFLNPFIEIYFRPKELAEVVDIPFYREVLWLFSKNLDNGLKMFQNRVNIIFVDSDSEAGNKKFASIYEHSVKVDVEKFKDLDEQSKKKNLLDIVVNGFLELATEYNWNKDVIEKSYERSKEEGFSFCYHTDFKLHRNKKDKGRIAITLKNNQATFNSELYNPGKSQVISVELLTTPERNFSWSGRIKDFGWLDESNFGLKLLGGELWIVVNKDDLEVTEIRKPKKRTAENIEEFLKELK